MVKVITTVKISKRTVELLSKLKIHPRQSYEEVILKLISKNKGKGNRRLYIYTKKEITTIKLSKRTVELLSKLKIHHRQSYEEVILKLLEKRRKTKF